MEQIPTISLQIHENDHGEVGIQIEKNPCAICLEEMLQKTLVLKPCNHEFHLKCINTLVETLGVAEKLKCPYCRGTVNDEITKMSTPSVMTSFSRNWTSDPDRLPFLMEILRILLIILCLFFGIAFARRWFIWANKTIENKLGQNCALYTV